MNSWKHAVKKNIRTLLPALVPILALLVLIVLWRVTASPRKAPQQTAIKTDKTPPSIFLTRDNRYFVEPGGQYEEEGYAAYDDVDGDVTKKVEVSVNGDLVQYKVKDSSGNITIRFRKIPYADEAETGDNLDSSLP